MLDRFDACETEPSILLLVVVQLGLPFIVIKPGWSERSWVFSTVQETFCVSRLTRLLTNSGYSEAELCFPRCFILAESHDKRSLIVPMESGTEVVFVEGLLPCAELLWDELQRDFLEHLGFPTWWLCAVSTFLREIKDCASFDDHCS